MKMNVIKFAELISYITNLSIGPKDSLTKNCIEEIAHIINEGVEPVVQYVGLSPNDVTAHLDEILKYCKQQKKIDAIRLVRQMSNMGLKEAKDWVEAMHAIGSLTKPVE